jgi:hypothetical protein
MNISLVTRQNSNYIAVEMLGHLERIRNRHCVCRRRLPCTHDFGVFR